MEAEDVMHPCKEASLQHDCQEREGDQPPSIPFLAEAATCADGSSQRTDSAPSRSSGLQSRLEVPFTDLTFHALIGKGSFKQVYRGKWNNTNVAIVAMRRGGLVTEARLMQQLGSHPNLVQFYRWSTDHRGNEYIVVELVPFGALDKVLVQFGPMLRNRSKLMMCEQICHAMSALAAEGVLHRDLAARNILVQSMQPVHVKVSDFGLARSSAHPEANQLPEGPQRRADSSNDSETAAVCSQATDDASVGPGGAEAAAAQQQPRAAAQAPAGVHSQHPQQRQGKPKGGSSLVPVRWSAPEVLRTGCGWSEKSDVYSYGVTMWEIFSNGAEPYANRSDVEAAASIVGGVLLQRPKNCPHQVYALMLDCWNSEPAKRPSFAQIADIYRRWRELTLAARASGAAASSAASRAASIDGIAGAAAAGLGAVAAAGGLRTLSGPPPPTLCSPSYPEHPQPPTSTDSGAGGIGNVSGGCVVGGGSGGYLTVSSLLVGHLSHADAPGPKALPAIPSGEILHLVGQSPPHFPSPQAQAHQRELQRQIEQQQGQQQSPPQHKSRQLPDPQHRPYGQSSQPPAPSVGPSSAAAAESVVLAAAGSPRSQPAIGRPHDSASSAPYEVRVSDGCGYGAPVRARSCRIGGTDDGGGAAAANDGAVRVIGQGRRSCVLPEEQRKPQGSGRESQPGWAVLPAAAATATATGPGDGQHSPCALVDAEAHATVAAAAAAASQPPPTARPAALAASMGGLAGHEPPMGPAAPALSPVVATVAAAADAVTTPHGMPHIAAVRAGPSSPAAASDPVVGADVGVVRSGGGGDGSSVAAGGGWQADSGQGLIEQKRSAPLRGPPGGRASPDPSAVRQHREAVARVSLQRRNTAGPMTLSRPSPLGLGTSRLVPELSRRSSGLSSQTTPPQAAGLAFSLASGGANRCIPERRSETAASGAAGKDRSGARRSAGHVLSRFEAEGPARLLRMASELTGEPHGTPPCSHANGSGAGAVHVAAAAVPAAMGAGGSVHDGGGGCCSAAAASAASHWCSLGGCAAGASMSIGGGGAAAGSSAGALFRACESCLLSMEVETAIDPMLSYSTAMLSTLNRTATHRDASGAAQLNSPVSLAAAAALVALRGQRRVSGLGRRPESGVSDGALESGLDSLQVIAHTAALGAVLREAAIDSATGPVLAQHSPTGRSGANAVDSTRGTTDNSAEGEYAAAREPPLGGHSPADGDVSGRTSVIQPQPLLPPQPAVAVMAGLLAGHLIQPQAPQPAAGAAAGGPSRNAAVHSPYLSIRLA